MKTAAFVPAKLESRRFPLKNLADFDGNPLVWWASQCARDGLAAGLFDRAVLSTDSTEIVAAAGRIEVDWRPEAMRAEGIRVIDLVREWLGRQEERPDAVCVLWPTSPLRTLRHLVESYRCLTPGFDVVLSVVPRRGGMLMEFLSRSDTLILRGTFSGKWQHDGTALWARHEFLVSPGAGGADGFYATPRIHGYRVPIEDSADVDTHFDLEYAEWLLERREQ